MIFTRVQKVCRTFKSARISCRGSRPSLPRSFPSCQSVSTRSPLIFATVSTARESGCRMTSTPRTFSSLRRKSLSPSRCLASVSHSGAHLSDSRALLTSQLETELSILIQRIDSTSPSAQEELLLESRMQRSSSCSTTNSLQATIYSVTAGSTEDPFADPTTS